MQIHLPNLRKVKTIPQGNHRKQKKQKGKSTVYPKNPEERQNSMIQEHLDRYTYNQQMNVSILRKQYGFNRFLFAGITKYISVRSVESYENKERIPSTASLLTISLSFGVSLDWLYGLSDIQYTRKSVMNAQFEYEQEFGETINLKMNVKYTLESLANIIVIKRAIKVLQDKNNAKMKDEISYLMTLEKRLESVMDTGKPEYIIE